MALNYLHKKNIIHRDIKLDNVLMKSEDVEDLTLKVTDFGFAKLFNPDVGLTDMLGSPLYMAPELVNGSSYSTGVDIWSTGVLLHILMTGEPPYVASSKKELFQMIQK